MPSPIRGSTKECLAHYFAQLPPTSQRSGVRARTPLIQYCGCIRRTVADWQTGPLPVGVYLIKLRFFLASQGYTVTELESLHPLVRSLGLILAEGRATLEELRLALGYSDQQEVLTILRGKQKPYHLEQRLQPLVDRYRAEPKPPATGVKPANGGAVRATPPSIPGVNGSQKGLVIKTLGAMIKAMLPLAKAVEASPFTVADRDALHELLPENEMFHLIYSLKRLTSETARRDIPPEAQSHQGGDRGR